jgi:sphingolipid 8-(E)-desaturase
VAPNPFPEVYAILTLCHGPTRLHSSEAKERVSRYRIGRIEGVWKNFVPPIQGGKFRPLVEGQAEEDDRHRVEDEVEEVLVPSAVPSSHSSSRDPSPVFDADESALRKRRGADGARRPDSASAECSASDSMDGMTYLDSQTREKIDVDLSKYPALEFLIQDDIARKYRALYDRIEAEGLNQCDYWAYAIEVTRYTLLGVATIVFLRWGWYVTSAVFLGAFWHQLVFAAHDAGHMGITHSFQGDSIIGIIIADFLGGLSLGWWKGNHNIHHIVTNSPENDPDIQHLPFFAISHRLLGSLYSTYYERIMEYDAFAKFMISIQSYTYYFILLFGRFNLYRLSWEYLILGLGPRKGPARWHRWFEFAGQAFFWTWFGYFLLYKSLPTGWDRFVYVMVSHMVTMPLHLQITLSHFAMSTAELGPKESFAQKMLRTTMDVDCPQWLDFFHGGLQFQAIHHLFPRVPRHNLRRTQKLVQEFCKEVGIPYVTYGFVGGNQEVVSRLAEVTRQARLMAKCQKVILESDKPIIH